MEIDAETKDKYNISRYLSSSNNFFDVCNETGIELELNKIYISP